MDFLLYLELNGTNFPFIRKYRSINVKFIPIISKLVEILFNQSYENNQVDIVIYGLFTFLL